MRPASPLCPNNAGRGQSMKEVWKDIKGDFYYHYQVSNFGEIRARYQNGVDWWKLKSCKKPGRYCKVGLRLKDNNRKSVSVHRLVAEAFLPRIPNKPCINHIDADKTNNMLSNLEWVTPKENMEHYSVMRRIRKGPYREQKNGIKVKCVETGIVYSSMKEAARDHYTTSTSGLRIVLDNPNRMAFGVHWVSV